MLGVVQEASSGDVDRAVQFAQAAFDGEWGSMTPDDRGCIFWKISEIVEANLERRGPARTGPARGANVEAI